jgi:hypothetical protein
VKNDRGCLLPHDQLWGVLNVTLGSSFDVTFSFPHLSAQPKQFTKTLVKLLACYWLLHRPRSDPIRVQQPRLTGTATTVTIVSNSTRIIRIFMSCFTTTTAVLTTPFFLSATTSAPAARMISKTSNLWLLDNDSTRRT